MGGGEVSVSAPRVYELRASLNAFTFGSVNRHSVAMMLRSFGSVCPRFVCAERRLDDDTPVDRPPVVKKTLSDEAKIEIYSRSESEELSAHIGMMMIRLQHKFAECQDLKNCLQLLTSRRRLTPTSCQNL